MPCSSRARALLLLTLVLVLGVPVSLTGCSDVPDGQPQRPSGTARAATATSPGLSSTTTHPPRPATGTAHGRALAVLREWDERRSAAYASGDPAALRRLYPPGSPLARRDVAVIRAYLRRGVRLTAVRHQVEAVTVHAAGPRTVRVTVTERLVATAEGDVGDRLLPRPPYGRRTVRLDRGPSGWWLSSASAG